MKKLLSVTILSVLTFLAYAQQCNSYFFQNKKSIEFSTYNKRGDNTGFIRYTIPGKGAKSSPNSAVINLQIFDKTGKLVANNTNTVKCSDDIMFLDMKLFLPQQQIEQFTAAESKTNTSFLEYPQGMKAGDHLKDGLFEMEVDKNGLKQALQMQITNRIVSGKQTITTHAGSWDCMVIQYKIKINVQTGPISIPLSIDATEWYAPSLGIVKSESESDSKELVAIK